MHYSAVVCVTNFIGRLQTQLALVTLKNSRQSLFVPELLVPDGWSTATLSQSRTLYKVLNDC